jgi:hypothetical protein
MAGTERRERDAQRDAVDRLMPADGDGSLLRMATGSVLVYEEDPKKRAQVSLRAAVMPNGEIIEFPTGRFRRAV